MSDWLEAYDEYLTERGLPTYVVFQLEMSYNNELIRESAIERGSRLLHRLVAEADWLE